MSICHVQQKSLSYVQLFATPWTIEPMEFSRPEYWSGQPFPSPGDLPNPGVNQGFPHCRQILYQLSYQEVIYRMPGKLHKQKLNQKFKRMRILDQEAYGMFYGKNRIHYSEYLLTASFRSNILAKHRQKEGGKGPLW